MEVSLASSIQHFHKPEARVSSRTSRVWDGGRGKKRFVAGKKKKIKMTLHRNPTSEKAPSSPEQHLTAFFNHYILLSLPVILYLSHVLHTFYLLQQMRQDSLQTAASFGTEPLFNPCGSPSYALNGAEFLWVVDRGKNVIMQLGTVS